MQLLRRTTRRVPLIPRRRGFLAGGPQTLKSAKAARRITGQAAAGQAGVIRLGFSAQTSYQVMHLLVRKFRQRFPLVRFEVLSPLSGGELSDRTSQHEVDVGLLRLPVSAPGLHVRELESHPLVAALPEGSVRAGDDARDAPATVASVAEVKGLEFDAVVLLEPAAVLAASPRSVRYDTL